MLLVVLPQMFIVRENLSVGFSQKHIQGGSVTLAWTCLLWKQLPKKLIISWQCQRLLLTSRDKRMKHVRSRVYTWGTGGFQRMFLRGAGVKPVVPVGLFFSSRTTPLGSSLSLMTKFFSCQPTWLNPWEGTDLDLQHRIHLLLCDFRKQVLTTVCWFTWITSSPAWIFLDRSAGDWRQKRTRQNLYPEFCFYQQFITGWMLILEANLVPLVPDYSCLSESHSKRQISAQIMRKREADQLNCLVFVSQMSNWINY